jgi:hypothetical protein
MFNGNFCFKLFVVVSQFIITCNAVSMDRHLEDIMYYITTQQPFEFDVGGGGGCEIEESSSVDSSRNP